MSLKGIIDEQATLNHVILDNWVCRWGPNLFGSARFD